jgi:drug/metabolite transporter (DMT)-like permease
LDLLVFILLLASAICHASWNTLTKASTDPWGRLAIGIAFSCLLACILLFFVPLPNKAAWPYLLASALAHQIYFALVCLGYRLGDLSQVYCIQRGIAPLLVAIGALIFANEAVSLLGCVGLFLISISILSLALTNKFELDNPNAITCALLTGAVIAAYTVIDGFGARSSENVFSYIVWLNVIDAVPFSLIIFYIRRKQLYQLLHQELSAGISMGLLGGAAYGTAIWALTHAPMAYVSALRETSVIIAAWLGCKLLKEPFGRKRIFAAFFIASGVFILQLS